jgi:hypothetical protein
MYQTEDTSGGPPTSRITFNVVWTGAVFTYLKYFVCSQIHHSGARFRFVANDCTPGSIEEMERFAEDHPDRVVEVVDVSPDRMVGHGQALDAVVRMRDDGEHFCLIDPDIKASGPFVDRFLAMLDSCAGVTSGQEVWNDDNVVPEGHLGVGGRHFFDRDGFVFGSPHLGFYRRGPLVETMDRWDVGFGSAGPELSPEATRAMAELGHEYRMYDTGKIINILLQADGHRIRHVEHPCLTHIGGMSHYLAPSGYVDVGDERRPEWARHDNMQVRFEVARYTAGLLRSLVHGEEPPAMRPELGPDVEQRLATVETEITDLLESHGTC